jgi:hypothetical protein
MSILIIIILILVGAFGFEVAVESGCQPVEDGCIETVTSTTWMPVEVDDVPGVIVAEEDGPRFLAADGFWTPLIDDLEAAEFAVAVEHGDLDHLRQYVGFIENGQQKIYINGFRDSVDLDWMSEPVVVEDGGEAFFQAVFNVESGELERFQFNGEA